MVEESYSPLSVLHVEPVWLVQELTKTCSRCIFLLFHVVSCGYISVELYVQVKANKLKIVGFDKTALAKQNIQVIG